MSRMKTEAIEIEAILERLSHVGDGRLPRQALEEAVARREEITPSLLEILETAKERHEEFIDSRVMSHTYAIYLLAQFREPRAYPLIVDLVSLPEDVLDRLTGDFVTEDLARVLGSVCDSDVTLICQLIENDGISEYVRGAAVKALVALAVNDCIGRPQVLAYFTELFHGKLTRSESHVWEALVSACADLALAELRDEIRQVYEEELVWPGYISPRNIEEKFDMGWLAMQARLARDPHLAFVEDVISEIEWWACFKQPKRARKRGKRRSAKASPTSEWIGVGTTVRKTEKIGRNQPCPCGSGKKYKKCCGSRT